MTNGRRSSPVPQLKCVGGTAGCGAFTPQVMDCVVLFIITDSLMLLCFFIRWSSVTIEVQMVMMFNGNARLIWIMLTVLEKSLFHVKATLIQMILMF
jgi:hypothetical protein